VNNKNSAYVRSWPIGDNFQCDEVH